MHDSMQNLEREVLCLSREERAFLADRLLSSLDGDILSDVDSAWIAEAEIRYERFKEGNNWGLRRRMFSPKQIGC